MFVGREAELKSLENLWDKGGFSFPVVYGRRRVGKTTLINEFCRGKPTIYFMAVQSTLKENLEILSERILSALAPYAPKTPFPSFREAVNYVFEQSKIQHCIFAIDEYAYLAESDPSVSSILQSAIDRYQSESRLFLILCGSSMSFMENQVLGYQSPLYGRRTAQYKLLPFDYLTAAKLLPGFTEEEKLALYAITGGTPEYLAHIDPGRSVESNVRDLFFDPSGRLFEEPTNLLKQELRDPMTYHAIIAAIARGRNRLNEIAAMAGIQTSQCSAMLATLMALGLVKKEHPVTEPKGKKSMYRLDDQMFVFWYRFVLPEASRIAQGLGDVACGELFGGHPDKEGWISDHVAHAFEQCAIQYMWRLQKMRKSPVPFREIGRWWGNNPARKQEEEIDFIACGEHDAIFGECKWRNQPVAEDVLEELIRKSGLFCAFQSKHYFLFSKKGYAQPLIRRAKAQAHVTLVTLEDLFA
jgi:AAA+ ATPase superfamily predicted ATPase